MTLGVLITFSHTAAVVVVGAAVLAAGRYLVPGVVVPVVTVVAGLVVLLLGLRLVRRRWRGTHGHGHDHSTARPSGLRGLAAVGASAGMVPCPEALSVLLLAIGLHRTALGLVMIMAFSLGLAAVLVGLGLLLVTASPVLSRAAVQRSGWLTTRLPLASALVVAVLGVAMTVTGVSALVG